MTMKHKTHLLFASALLGGCTQAPSINVLGAFFPDWLFCALGAMVLTALLSRVLQAAGCARGAGTWANALAHAALWTLLALAIWLVCFQN